MNPLPGENNKVPAELKSSRQFYHFFAVRALGPLFLGRVSRSSNRTTLYPIRGNKIARLRSESETRHGE